MIICFISYMFPGKHDNSSFAFVKQLVDAFAEQGHYCYVLAPFNITHYRRLVQSKEEYYLGKGRVTVYRPGYLSFSNWHVGKFRLSSWSHKVAMGRAFRMLNVKPDVVYGHFWSAGYDGFEYAKKNRIPLFVATGESEVKRMFSAKPDIHEFRDYVSGVVCVSRKNRDESVELGLTTLDKCIVLPNAVNTRLFRKMDKRQCRERLGVPFNAFIVIFVGWFNERKGSERVAEAIKRIKGELVYSIFVGKGEKEPNCNGVLFVGALSHELIPLYLNAADVFVLPTLHEGCCNAIVEAMACGLPIISSNRSFNWDVLNETNSIMVDPESIDEIAEAISLLRDDSEMRERLSAGSLAAAKSLSIEHRAETILNLITETI